MRLGLTRTATAIALAAAWLAGCTVAVPGAERPEASARREGNAAYSLPDTPFTRADMVVTATCLMGARYAAISVQAWDPARWVPIAERFFAIPDTAAFTNYPGATAVATPLVDLCRQRADEQSPYRVDVLEHIGPRVRALFDLAFTRMAVVLRDPGGATHAGFVPSDGEQNDVVALSSAPGDDEQNAVMSPDGQRVWFTYTEPGGTPMIGSRATGDDHRLSREGRSAGHSLPLTVWGKPPLAVQADMVRFSPDGSRVTAATPRVVGHVFDVPATSGSLSGPTVSNATHMSGCLGVVGWTDDTHVLCHTDGGVFRVMDASAGRATAAPIKVADSEAVGLTTEGALVAANGTAFIVSVHPANDRYWQGLPDFRVVSTQEGKESPIIGDGLITTTYFLQWG